MRQYDPAEPPLPKRHTALHVQSHRLEERRAAGDLETLDFVDDIRLDVLLCLVIVARRGINQVRIPVDSFGILRRSHS